ncbi:SPOR domain-containing protein [Cohnella zeiphila]|uniref:SPOR domain-containing protein n=1 Tax=Cohnella zeiphila TaxID=2761120 RepID=A0A7X0VTF7_9BACL|nr:SPOR domain-containing protein [Cohnella zeiphila]MBB6729310.1 SPOR domain-containing protein [Cohnella zeiphila]
MQPKARMTFRFDGAAPRETEQGNPPKPAEPQPAVTAGKTEDRGHEPRSQSPASRTPHFQSWNSPFQDDIHALEEIIRSSDRPAVAGFSKADGKRGGGRSPRTPDIATESRLPEEGRDRDDEAFLGRRPGPEDRSVRFPGRSLRPAGKRTVSEHPVASEEPVLQPADPRRTRSASRLAESKTPANPYPFAPRPASGSSLADEPNREPPYLDEEEDRGPEIDLPESWTSSSETYARGGTSWWRILVTVASAILTGGFFGYLLLALFTGQPLFASDGAAGNGAVPAMATPAGTVPDSGSASAGAAPPSASAGASSASGSAAAAGTDKAAASSSVGSTAVPSADYYMLQYGVFGNEDSMNAALKELQDQGVPAASDTTDGYRVYAGIAPAKADAENMAERLSGVQVYVKSVENSEVDVGDSAHAAEWSAYLKSSSALYLKIATITSAALAGSGDGKANTADIQAVEKAYQTWSDLADQAPTWDKSAKDAASTETTQMGAAVAALDEYAGKPSTALLEQAQTAVMKAAIADRQLRETLRLETGS